jgi:crotonobetainyl-CoA:carnitine CoA-transferase CaiB-like acyl-CoA transferase
VLAQLKGMPAALERSAPALDADAAMLRARAVATTRVERVELPLGTGATALEGTTVLELGTYYAAPYGATLLAELGARVIKIEELSGDPMRNMMPFPEVAGIKALQGKESFAVDIATEAGRQLVYELVSRADVVLQSFRAGVADRLKVDAATLRAINPSLIYLEAPGYGTGGPYGHRPAFAPTIGAAAGLAWRNAGSSIPDGPELGLEQVKQAAIPLALAVMGAGNCDGFASVSVATAMLLGLLVRERTGAAEQMLTTMIGSATHALCETLVSYDAAPQPMTADVDLYGYGPCYRLYEAAEGWVFFAAPSDAEFAAASALLDPTGSLGVEARFATVAARKEHEAELAELLAAGFLAKTAADWEQVLLAADVACVEVAAGPPEACFMDEGQPGQLSGLVTTAWHPMLDDHERLAPLVSMSRSRSVAGNGCTIGQHTDTIMAELGHSDEAIADLRFAGVIGG